MGIRSVRSLKITTLAENSCGLGTRGSSSGCLGQWGLSFLLEFVDEGEDRRKVIFDAGMHKEALLRNIRELKVDLSDIDCIVLSHGHLDHTAATAEIVKAAGGTKVYAHPHTFLPRLFRGKTGKRRDIGVPKGEGEREIEDAGGEIILRTEPTEISPGVWTTGQIERVTRFEQPLPLSEGERLTVAVDGKEVDDKILDDQALWMHVDQVGPVVITGCAHAGPVNTLLHVQKLGGFKQIHSLVGGTHLMRRTEEYVQQTINELKQFRLSLISPCHCTGFRAMARLWQAFPEAFVWNFSGRTIEIGKEIEDRMI